MKNITDHLKNEKIHDDSLFNMLLNGFEREENLIERIGSVFVFIATKMPTISLHRAIMCAYILDKEWCEKSPFSLTSIDYCIGSFCVDIKGGAKNLITDYLSQYVSIVTDNTGTERIIPYTDIDRDEFSVAQYSHIIESIGNLKTYSHFTDEELFYDMIYGNNT